ncbi:MAG: NADAR family protein [Bacilli bacterium]|nr:NADAR family protein [Bacilli bacterium]
MKVTDKYVYFWGGIFSNFYPSKFEIGGLTFENNEMYFMWMKALMFNDSDVMKLIYTAGGDPSYARQLGRRVANYNDELWSSIRYNVMRNGVYNKFSQNKELRDEILSKKYEGKHFVEASPIDGIWGIKCGEDEALDDQSNWNGQNLLGKALDEVREELLKNKK